jgi:hypothetical protein
VAPEEPTVGGKRLGKHVSEATDTEATTEELSEAMFSVLSVSRRLHSEGHGEKSLSKEFTIRE